jgi:hypothetical protein
VRRPVAPPRRLPNLARQSNHGPHDLLGSFRLDGLPTTTPPSNVAISRARSELHERDSALPLSFGLSLWPCCLGTGACFSLLLLELSHDIFSLALLLETGTQKQGRRRTITSKTYNDESPRRSRTSLVAPHPSHNLPTRSSTRPHQARPWEHRTGLSSRCTGSSLPDAIAQTTAAWSCACETPRPARASATAATLTAALFLSPTPYGHFARLLAPRSVGPSLADRGVGLSTTHRQLRHACRDAERSDSDSDSVGL